MCEAWVAYPARMKPICVLIVRMISLKIYSQALWQNEGLEIFSACKKIGPFQDAAKSSWCYPFILLKLSMFCYPPITLHPRL